jgi:predicted O-methyltransferase YrrM
MTVVLEHPHGTVVIERKAPRHAILDVTPANGVYAPLTHCETSYPDSLVREILDVMGPAWLIDELLRDESPNYVQRALHYGLLSFVSRNEFAGKRLLDFGCGKGASTSILARMLPETQLVGIELESTFLRIARSRARHYGFDDRVEFHPSPDPSSLPESIGTFDFISFSAVVEHLLPGERAPLLNLVWSALRPGGVLFINQSPNRFGLVEFHTTAGLPFLNYLPDSLAELYARRMSRRSDLAHLSWEELLRAGIRGTSKGEIDRLLRSGGNDDFEFLSPGYEGIRDTVDLWARSTSVLDSKTAMVKRGIELTARVALPFRSIILPTVIMALRKRH